MSLELWARGAERASLELTWQTLDWRILDRLRARFLARETGGASYWTGAADVAHYDFTYGRRIGWKWDAVLGELARRGWRPPPGPLLDWGCGSGVAGRKVAAAFGMENYGRVLLHDRARAAVEYAKAEGRRQKAEGEAEEAEFRNEGRVAAFTGREEFGTLVVSHVLNELDEAGRAELRGLLARARAVLWVEPGTYADSRALIEFREELRGEFAVVAPCTHGARCGMLHAHNAPHWCHFFAAPPPGVPGDADWVAFARRAGVDLRSLPYSFLVLEREGRNTAEGWSRVIGHPRVYKGYAKALDCSAADVREAAVQRRDEPEVFRRWKKGGGPALWKLGEGVKGWVRVEAEMTNDSRVCETAEGK